MEKQINPPQNDILNRLIEIQTNISFIREHIEDITLNEDDLKAINEARQDLRTGKTRRL